MARVSAETPQKHGQDAPGAVAGVQKRTHAHTNYPARDTGVQKRPHTHTNGIIPVKTKLLTGESS